MDPTTIEMKDDRVEREKKNFTVKGCLWFVSLHIVFHCSLNSWTTVVERLRPTCATYWFMCVRIAMLSSKNSENVYVQLCYKLKLWRTAREEEEKTATTKIELSVSPKSWMENVRGKRQRNKDARDEPHSRQFVMLPNIILTEMRWMIFSVQFRWTRMVVGFIFTVSLLDVDRNASSNENRTPIL